MAEELCPDCVRGDRLSGTPQGSMVETPALPAYFTPANGGDGTQKTSKVIVILPDVFGLKLVNVKLIADMLAKSTGMDVWVADIFKGRPICTEDDLAPYLPEEPKQRLSLWERVREGVLWTRIITLGLPSIIEFEAQDTWVLRFVEFLRTEHHYEQVGMMGYCWGGGLTTRIAAVKDSGVNSAIGIHIGYKYKSALPNAVIPIAHFIPEEDDMWDANLAANVERKWKAEGKKHLFKVYPGTRHGFASRPNLGIPKIKESWEAIMQDIPSWFNETLNVDSQVG